MDTFFFCCIPSYISGGFHFWRDFWACDHSFNPTIEVVTIHLCGWCMLGVFLLPAFTHLGHECRVLFEFVWWNAYVHRLDLSLYSHQKEFYGMESKPTLTPREKSPLLEAQSRVELMTQHKAGQPTHYPLSYSGPHGYINIQGLSNWSFALTLSSLNKFAVYRSKMLALSYLCMKTHQVSWN